MTLNFTLVKNVEGRILRCLAEATRPVSLEELFVDLEQKYQKNYRTGLDRDTFNNALMMNGRNGWIDPRELQVLSAGRHVYQQMCAERDGWAEKFFRPSNSPNVPVPTQLALPDFSAKATTW